MLAYPLPNFEIQNYYKNKPIFNSVYSRNSLPKIKDGACVVNLHELKSIVTHCISLDIIGYHNILW